MTFKKNHRQIENSYSYVKKKIRFLSVIAANTINETLYKIIHKVLPFTKFYDLASRFFYSPIEKFIKLTHSIASKVIKKVEIVFSSTFAIQY